MIEPCRRDDLESIGYMLVYFMRGQLPWSGLYHETESKHRRLILKKKESISLNRLCEGLPRMY